MKVGDLVTFPNSVAAPQTGIVLSTKCDGKALGYRCIGESTEPLIGRVKVYWIEDAESSWEPVKWLEIINPS